MFDQKSESAWEFLFIYLELLDFVGRDVEANSLRNRNKNKHEVLKAFQVNQQQHSQIKTGKYSLSNLLSSMLPFEQPIITSLMKLWAILAKI